MNYKSFHCVGASWLKKLKKTKGVTTQMKGFGEHDVTVLFITEESRNFIISIFYYYFLLNKET